MSFAIYATRNIFSEALSLHSLRLFNYKNTAGMHTSSVTLFFYFVYMSIQLSLSTVSKPNYRVKPYLITSMQVVNNLPYGLCSTVLPYGLCSIVYQRRYIVKNNETTNMKLRKASHDIRIFRSSSSSQFIVQAEYSTVALLSNMLVGTFQMLICTGHCNYDL